MKKALLVIDAQKIYSLKNSDYHVDGVKEIVARINGLIDIFQRENEFIVYIRHEHALDGSDSGRMFDFTGEEGDIEFKKDSEQTEFIDDLKIIEGYPILTKTRYDAFISTPLNAVLEQNGIERVVVCGFMTNFCCESTARHAHDVDYFVDFVSDATGTPGTEQLSPEETVQATLATLESGYATIVSTSDFE